MPPKKPTTRAKKKDGEPLGPVIIRKKTTSTRIERDAGSGRFEKTGTESQRPKTTVTEPRNKK